MRAVIQRVTKAKLTIDKNITRNIGNGLLVLSSFEDSDNLDDLKWISGKIVRLRIFKDELGIMNKSVQEIKGQIMVVSQFTLHASTKRGNRPYYIRASKPKIAIPLYEKFLSVICADFGNSISSGEFGTDMQIELVNDGPVTIILDSKNKE
jgi:D-aminoacyl-tRNA deacylase